MIITKYNKLIWYFFLIATTSFITSLVKEEKKYIWQQDDTVLVGNMPDKFTFALPPVQKDETLSPEQLKKLKEKALRWLPFQIVRPPLTESARENKKQIKKFLSTYIKTLQHHAYNRDQAMDEITAWHHDKIALLLEDPLFDTFTQNCWQKKDAKSLYVIATLLDKVGRTKSAKDSKTYEYHQGRMLEKKALDILVKIQNLPHINKMLQAAIKSHLEYLWLNDYELKDYYDATSDPLAGSYPPLPRFNLGWMQSEGVEISHQASGVPAQPAAPQKFKEKIQAKKIEHENSQPDTEYENKRKNVALLAESKKLYSAGRYDESAQKAWAVIKTATPNGDEHKRAMERMELLSKKHYSSPHSLYMQCLLHAQSPAIAINFFIQAQSTRKDNIIKAPEKTSPMTFTSLLVSSLEIVHHENDEAKQAFDLIKSWAEQKNQHALQALAVYFHRNATEMPEMQLLCLRSAAHYLNQLNLQSSEGPLAGCNVQQIYFDYYQQLYVFARKHNNYVIDGQIPLNRLLKATVMVADAYARLKDLEKYGHSRAAGWANAALFTFKNHLNQIQKIIDGTFDDLTICKTTEVEQIQLVTNLILEGQNGLPLSIKQRQKIINSIMHTQVPLMRCLREKKYEGSPYEAIAIQENKPYSQEFYRMLFAIDCGDFREGLSIAKKLSKEFSDTKADMFIKNILLSTDLVLKTHAQKLVSIQNLLEEIKNHNKTFSLVPLFCDAIQLLEQMAAAHFIPAIELLLDMHWADDHDHQNIAMIIKYFDQIKTAALEQPTFTPDEIPRLLSDNIRIPLAHFCDASKNTDVIWAYLDCLAHILVNTKNKDHAQRIAANIDKIGEGIDIHNAQSKGKDNKFLNKSTIKEQLASTVDSFLRDKQIIAQLRDNQCYDTMHLLAFHLNPDNVYGNIQQEIQVSGQLAEQIFDGLFETTTKHDEDQDATVNNGPSSESAYIQNEADVPQNPFVQKYVNSPQFQVHQKITEYRRNRQFQEYKDSAQKNKICLDNRNLDVHLKIQTLLLLAAHSQMLAQAESEKPLDIFDIHEATAFTLQAIKIHPFYACLAIAHSCIAHEIWPYNPTAGQKFLEQASSLAEKNRNNLTMNQIIHLNHLKAQYRIHRLVQLGITS